MIECSTDNIWYKKRRKFKIKHFTAFFIIFFILITFFLYNKYIVARQIYNICADNVYSFSTQAVNRTIFNSLDLTFDYTDLIFIEKNSAGEIILMSANSQKINYINKKIALGTEESLNMILKDGVPIPLFSFSGIDILYGYGPIIYYKSINIVSILCDFISSFKNVGINNTLHSIYIEVTSNVKIRSFFNSKIIESKNKILISEAVLVGKVPEMYLDGNLFDNA